MTSPLPATTKKRILVVDDERDIVELVSYNLSKEGYEVVTAFNGREALDRVPTGVDLVILDLMMPVLDGLETCKRLKTDPATASIPIIILTARSGEVDEILGLELGADDYIRKPISPRKLVARVKAVLRRSEHPGEEFQDRGILRAGPIEINRPQYAVRVSGREVSFPRKEFQLLALLASDPGTVYTRDMLLNAIWGSGVYVVDRTVDVHIRKIREKLGAAGELIETVKGVGYRLRA